MLTTVCPLTPPPIKLLFPARFTLPWPWSFTFDPKCEAFFSVLKCISAESFVKIHLVHFNGWMDVWTGKTHNASDQTTCSGAMRIICRQDAQPTSFKHFKHWEHQAKVFRWAKSLPPPPLPFHPFTFPPPLLPILPLEVGRLNTARGWGSGAPAESKFDAF